MAEYIEREAVIELLEEKQRAICPAGRCGHGYVYGRDRDEYDAIESDIDAVQNIPAADVRPVVLCINCLRLKEGTCPVPLLKSDESFCSWGEDMREVDDED